MRKTVLLLASMVLGVLLLGGVALAANIACKVGSTPNNPCLGTNEFDEIRGTRRGDYIRGLGSGDFVKGAPGADALLGDSGSDELRGESGGDRLYGGDGRDTLNGGVGVDWLSGEAGPDTISSADGAVKEKDFVHCGAGFDRVLADYRDVIAGDCEDIFRIR